LDLVQHHAEMYVAPLRQSMCQRHSRDEILWFRSRNLLAAASTNRTYYSFMNRKDRIAARSPVGAKWWMKCCTQA
jgi:hypothetical protein